MAKRHGHAASLARTRVYSIWKNMRFRCNNPNAVGWERYGGRGIRTCARWALFEHFLADMGPPPSRAHSIERIDNSGDYEPGNCRWATTQEQSLNRRTNRRVTFQGRTLCVSEWAEKLGLKFGTLYSRLLRGESLERAMTPHKLQHRPLKSGPKLTVETVRIIRTKLSRGALGKELAREYGVSPTLISNIALNKCWRHA